MQNKGERIEASLYRQYTPEARKYSDDYNYEPNQSLNKPKTNITKTSEDRMQLKYASQLGYSVLKVKLKQNHSLNQGWIFSAI